MEEISANLKIIGTNGLLKDLLDKEFKAYSIVVNEISCILIKIPRLNSLLKALQSKV